MVVWTFIAIIFVIGVGRVALSNNMKTGNGFDFIRHI